MKTRLTRYVEAVAQRLGGSSRTPGADLDAATPVASPPLPQAAEEVLRPDHPLLAEYERRYHDHPATARSQWSGTFIDHAVDMRFFRANSAYVCQQWDRADPFRYGLVAYYTRLHDRLGLFDVLHEDGLFGADTYEIDGRLVSRDLLDSITELTFIEDEVGLSDGATILDIGAGYGRLAHRATTAFENVTYLCADAIPLSTFLSRFYLDFRGVRDRAAVIPLDEVAEAIEGKRIDLAVNIHSFSECPVTAIQWWLDLLSRNDVRRLMVVPNQGLRLVSKELVGPKVDFLPLIRSAGFDLLRTRPKYGDSEFMQRHGLHGRFPAFYFLFERRR